MSLYRRQRQKETDLYHWVIFQTTQLFDHRRLIDRLSSHLSVPGFQISDRSWCHMQFPPKYKTRYNGVIFLVKRGHFIFDWITIMLIWYLPLTYLSMVSYFQVALHWFFGLTQSQSMCSKYHGYRNAQYRSTPCKEISSFPFYFLDWKWLLLPCHHLRCFCSEKRLTIWCSSQHGCKKLNCKKNVNQKRIINTMKKHIFSKENVIRKVFKILNKKRNWLNMCLVKLLRPHDKEEKFYFVVVFSPLSKIIF